MLKKKSFSEEEKSILKEKLCKECEQAWAIKGYKKTSISYLTSKVNISTGAFYLLYQNKEELFSETLKRVQDELKVELETILSSEPNRNGLVKALKWLYREYNQRRYLYDFNNPDFQSFISKIPKEEISSLKMDSMNFSDYIIKKADLIYKVEKQSAFDVIQALLYTVSIQDSIVEDKVSTFDLILDNIISKLFE